MIRQSNSITVLLFIQNNSYKNKLKHACLHRCSVYLYRDVQDIKGCLVICKYSPNSRCRPSSCLLAVLSMFLANSSPISSSRNEGNFVLTTKTTQPRPQVFSVNCSVFQQLCCTIDFIPHISQNSSKFAPSTAAGYDELCVGFQAIRNGEIF